MGDQMGSGSVAGSVTRGETSRHGNSIPLEVGVSHSSTAAVPSLLLYSAFLSRTAT
jgi:hypothetical protein